MYSETNEEIMKIDKFLHKANKQTKVYWENKYTRLYNWR